MGRSPCCAKEGLNRGAWTATEDKTLSDYIKQHGEGGWRNLPIKAGLRRCGKSCRLRWLNYLRPDIKRGNISSDEEDLIIRLHKLLGNRWSLIAGRLPGRTDNEIKNYWNTNLAKKVHQLSTSSSSRKSSTTTESKGKNKRSVKRTSDETRASKHKIEASSSVVKTKALKCTKQFFTTTSQPQPQIVENHDKTKALKCTKQFYSTSTTPQSQVVENHDKIRGSSSTEHYKQMDLLSGSGFSGFPLRGKSLSQNYEMGNFCFSDFYQLNNFDGEKKNEFSSPSSDESLMFLDEMIQNWTGNDYMKHAVPSEIPSLNVLGSEDDWLKG